MNRTGDVVVCEGSVATFYCSYIDGSFPHFMLNGTGVSKYSHLNVTSSWSGTVLHLEVPGEPWSNNAIIQCVVSGISSDPAVLHVQGPQSMCDGAVGSSVMVTLNHSRDFPTVPPSTSGSSIPVSTNTPTTPGGNTCGVDCIIGIIASAVLVALIGVFITPVVYIIQKRKRASATINTNSPLNKVEEAGSKDVPVQDTSGTPLQDTSGTPLQDTPVTPLQDTPVTPLLDTSVTPLLDTSGTSLLDTPVDASPGHRAFQRNVNSVVPEQPGASNLKSFQKLAQKDTGIDDRECSNGEENAAHFWTANVEALDKNGQSNLVIGTTSQV
ncbi:hypothetical protein EMCRGX_G004231 [Ephydatia muelleri]